MTELAFPSGLSTGGRGYVGLRALRDRLAPTEVLRFRDVPVEGLCFHSAEARAGDVFFAVRGTHQDGAAYAAHAVARGAVAVVAEEPISVDCPVLVVDNCRHALADAACDFYGDPSLSLPVIGITGTNGKTTVAHLVRDCLVADNRSTGLLGTIAYEFHGRRIPATTTTPDPVHVHGYLREMVDHYAQACVMEVSSHALAQERVRGVRFQTAAFLNLSQDHLDYHGDMRSYARAKARLFEQLAEGGTACLAADSPVSGVMAEQLSSSARILRFGMDPNADVRAENVHCTLAGTRFDLVMPRGRVELFLRLTGMHNVQNALAAAAIALSLGVSELTIASALEDAEPVQGRLETVGRSCGAQVVVDYAHTPDALDKVCGTLRDLTEGRLIVVFGCGGDRDQSKRALMSSAVGKHAHVGVLTSDNPRSEDPEQILDDMVEGLAEAQGTFYRIADREQAIRRAIGEAQPGDTVLIAGKGHEAYQILKDSVIPFDDRLVAREAMFDKEA